MWDNAGMSLSPRRLRHARRACALFALGLLASPTHGSPAAEAALDWAWRTTSSNFCDSTLVAARLTPERHAELVEVARRAESLDDLAAALNPLLLSLGVSHTAFFTDSDLEYHLFRSMPPANDAVYHIGIQCSQIDQGWVIRSAWSGYPADRAGIRRGDVIEEADFAPFHPIRSFRSGAPAVLTVRRNGEHMMIRLEPVLESINESLVQAMRNSVRRIDDHGNPISYVRLWSCTHPAGEAAFAQIIRELADTEGIILDLRDGFGGAWFRYLDPLFASRDRYAAVTVIPRRGATLIHRDQETEATSKDVAAQRSFDRPVVALINEGTRSGKEGIAFQLKRSGRAILVGTTTSGAFSGGEIYIGEYRSCILYLAVNRLRLDGEEIEGRGVAPDEVVDYPLTTSLDHDPQLERALARMSELVR